MSEPARSIINETTLSQSEGYENNSSSLKGKLKDYYLLIKFRLSFIVVFSAAAGYALHAPGIQDWNKFLLLILGGFLVTAASNAFNQVIERDTDKLMDRTKNRPIPAGRMSIQEGIVAGSIMAISGVFILGYYMNPLCGLLSLISLILYTLAYTPMKRHSPIAVFVGAIPGAMPPLLGWVASSGEIGFSALLIFFLQFIWQFPHFWAIAWVLDDDYSKAGFKLLPSVGGKNRTSAFQITVYAAALIPIGTLPYFFGITGIISTIVILIAGIGFTLQSLRLLKSLDHNHAKQLMFGSFLYLPVVLIAMLADKI